MSVCYARMCACVQACGRERSGSGVPQKLPTLSFETGILLVLTGASSLRDPCSFSLLGVSTPHYPCLFT